VLGCHQADQGDAIFAHPGTERLEECVYRSPCGVWSRMPSREILPACNGRVLLTYETQGL